MINDKLQDRRPLRVELVGPAGVGKSTLSEAMLRRYDAAPGEIWGRPALPLLWNGVRLLPTLAGLWWHARSPLWDESRHLVRLRTLHHALRQEDWGGNQAIVFDEGPVFALAWLRGFGHETMRSEQSERWWHTAIAEWAQVIDAIVVLDAPDSTLATRIRARSQSHEVKGILRSGNLGLDGALSHGARLGARGARGTGRPGRPSPGHRSDPARAGCRAGPARAGGSSSCLLKHWRSAERSPPGRGR